MKKFNKKWFTLIEMLIVVVIIGILAAALIPRLTSVKDKANDSSRKASLQQLVTAMSSYALDQGVFKSTSWTGTSTIWTGTIGEALAKWGMKSIPTDPSNKWNTIYGTLTTGFVYISAKKWGVADGGFVVASFAETTSANYVECTPTDITNNSEIDGITTCSTVSKGGTCSFTGCTYTGENSLRLLQKY